MAKRSPILGYNHNVRYRGLIFHVQTEDSGVLSPHLFTHLFYEGVIVSTRKLVYDAGASEEAIKALMQAQHKAVLKDLKQRAFDDKIDQYLGGTPGLEPREGGAPPPLAERPRASEPEIKIDAGERAGTEPAETPIEAAPQPAPRARRKSAAPKPADKAPEPVAKPVAREPEPVAAKPPEPALVDMRPQRTKTAERTSRASQFRSMPPPPPPAEDNAPTLSGADAAAVAAEMHAQHAATVPTPAPVMRPTPPPAIPARPPPPRAATPPPIPPAARSKASIPINADSSPEIEIIRQDDTSARNRSTRDTAVDNPHEAVPSAIAPDATLPSDGVPGRIGADSAPPFAPRNSTPSRPPSHGAATLPPVRPPSRPSITPASVVSRPLPPEQRNRDNTDAIEVYAPAPPSVEPPPGERAERPGQYSMKRGARDQDVPMREHTGRVAIPAGLGRPRTPPPVPRTAASSSPPSSIVPESMRGVPQPVRPEPTPGRSPSSSEAAPRPKSPSERVPTVAAPTASRTGTGNSNVVMTRPAVIVGAPPKTPTATPTRVRKAREDEGRGFGQGLISEKSLDEVILAYLSEDAEEK